MRNSREGVKTVNETLTRAFSTHSFKETPHLECVAVSCNQHSSADFLSGLKGLGATPQRAGIEPFGIAMEHRAEEVRAPCMRPQKFIGGVEVLPSLGDHAGSVIVVFGLSPLQYVGGNEVFAVYFIVFSLATGSTSFSKGSPGWIRRPRIESVR